jgi:hypothetical protein
VTYPNCERRSLLLETEAEELNAGVTRRVPKSLNRNDSEVVTPPPEAVANATNRRQKP